MAAKGRMPVMASTMRAPTTGGTASPSRLPTTRDCARGPAAIRPVSISLFTLAIAESGPWDLLFAIDSIVIFKFQ